mmetsp:Transcript_40417/g.49023  ORF Transcript_40417/g.49023 Transcript_40417/m.49023 type:complete len:119 (+) Transcript_40417:840-1196(+)
MISKPSKWPLLSSSDHKKKTPACVHLFVEAEATLEDVDCNPQYKTLLLERSCQCMIFWCITRDSYYVPIAQVAEPPSRYPRLAVDINPIAQSRAEEQHEGEEGMGGFACVAPCVHTIA